MSAGHGQVGIAISLCAQRKAGPLAICPKLLVHCWLVVVALAGCARFPAIDPNGQSIFLPYPAATQLTVPQIHAGNGNPGIIPQDAYPSPIPPPACIDGSCAQPTGIQNLFQHHQKKKQAIANHFAKKDPGQCGQIQLSPQRIVAPVNGEVLLLAGICGKDGYLLKREPLEWMLAPGSVGQFIEVGDDAKGKLCSSLRSGPKVEKLGVDYARGRTSSKATLLTKGTPGCDDDLEVAEGQTWLSISSPNEGVSHVTVLAPDSELWDKRRQTATIYWVDSQASFPEPIRIDTSPQGGELITRVTSAINNVAATGWLVRYTIVDPRIAGFVRADGQLETNSNIIVTRVNEDGIASVRVRALGPVGVTPVHLEVIRPIQPAEKLPELILHQADTFVTVSAPGLDLAVNGPRMASVGEIVEFVASLGNPGDLNAENVSLKFAAPAGTTIIEVRPQPNTNVPGAIAWQQGVLEAGRQVDFVIRLRLDAPGDLALQFQGEAVGLTDQENYPVRVVAPSVNVSMVRVPENTTGQAEVGEVVYYEVGVKNTGVQTLVNLVMQIDTSVGWQEASRGVNSVPFTIPMLQPGQTETIPVALRVIQQGQHTANVTVKNANGDVMHQSPPVGLTGTPSRPRRPRIEATIRTAPENQTRVGEATFGYFIVNNTGETPLENLDVTIKYDPVLEALKVDMENLSLVRTVPGSNNTLRWTPPRLLPGQVVQLAVQFTPRAAATAAGLAMTVVNGETTASTTGGIQIIDPAGGSVLPPGANNAPNNAAGAGQPRTGNWQVSFESMQNPTVVGNQVTLMLDVKNGQNQADSNLKVQLTLPEGMELNSIQRGGAPIAYSQTDRGVYVLPAEKFIRANDDPIRYFINVTPRIVQEAVLTIGIVSDGQPTPQYQRKSVTVNPR